ncbi:hypothetical protein K701_09625 [Streptomyces fradiae ATCC 10745 = DSM 40063]|uniref:Uncharacterized protein n=1 Tax=Streptomyces fradiae ATCC 10745 = DSM 40063 TaxID=1319510 RepID=A0ABQ6XPR0_STRFR|nr:hypothetical protein K701_22035 [Streptomyces fradiae ATCC 10745 = DSM 40063]KAF0650038.1 hypothetical protein K701_09625 [Streptomyces fradiae ATCC 10745 = DSM 40063]
MPSGRTHSTRECSPPPGRVVYAIHRPSGDHATSVTGSGPASRRCASAPSPSTGPVHSCGTPPRSQTYAIRAP